MCQTTVRLTLVPGVVSPAASMHAEPLRKHNCSIAITARNGFLFVQNRRRVVAPSTERLAAEAAFIFGHPCRRHSDRCGVITCKLLLGDAGRKQNCTVFVKSHKRVMTIWRPFRDRATLQSDRLVLRKFTTHTHMHSICTVTSLFSVFCFLFYFFMLVLCIDNA